MLLACLLLALAACGGTAGGAGSASVAEKQLKSRDWSRQRQAPATRDPGRILGIPEESEAPEIAPPPAGKPGELPSIAEQVLLNEQGVKVTALSMEYREYSGPVVNIRVENDSDKTVGIMIEHGAVNGVMMYLSMGCELKPGKKENTEIRLRDEYLAEAGIDTVGTLTMMFSVYDTEEYENLFQSQPVVLKTSAAGQAAAPAQPAGTPLFGEQGLTVRHTAFTSSEDYPAVVQFYVENKTEGLYSISADEVSINGYMVYGMMYGSILPGCVAYVEMEFTEEDLAECNISGVDGITELEFMLYFLPNTENRYDERIESDMITLTK